MFDINEKVKILDTGRVGIINSINFDGTFNVLVGGSIRRYGIDDITKVDK